MVVLVLAYIFLLLLFFWYICRRETG